jgi:heptose I phosphotransferase
MMTLQGTVFREQKGRVTQRVEIDGNYYFLKRQTSVGWKEIIKNLLQLRQPVLTMKNEWQAIEKLRSLNIQTPRVIAKGERGANPLQRESFVLLEEIAPAMSLEDVCAVWQQHPPAFELKQKCIEQVAAISKKMHDGGVNHRDFYLCHFLLKTEKPSAGLQPADVNLYLIDMHRAQIRSAVPQRWRIKDLAGLYFSSKDAGLSRRDLFRFMQIYQGKSLRQFMQADWQLWKKVKDRGEQLYRDHQVS